MNRDYFHGLYMQVGGRLQQQWGTLTHNPLITVAGFRRRCAGRMLEQYGILKQEAERQLKDFMRRHRNWLHPPDA